MTLSEHIFTIHSLILDTFAYKFFIGDNEIPLRRKEFSLLLFFIKNSGRVLSRTEILEEVWDRNICCNTNTVDVHVSILRKKIKKYVGRPLIRTIHSVGYVLE